MKKLILTMLFAITSMTVVLAREGNIDARVEKAFKNKFSSATEVTWKKSETSYQVTFTNYHSVLYATYSVTGKLMEVRRNISPLDLSGHLQKSLKTYYDAHWVIDLVEITKGDVKAYYVTLEGPEDKVMMESKAGSKWEMITVMNKTGNYIINK
jgi:hypothetical protein